MTYADKYQEHFKKAEQLLEKLGTEKLGTSWLEKLGTTAIESVAAAAQVHATLALAAATRHDTEMQTTG